jgi:uncharacterized protein (DUF3084 family)/predicted lactoylglutathione lyase
LAKNDPVALTQDLQTMKNKQKQLDDLMSKYNTIKQSNGKNTGNIGIAISNGAKQNLDDYIKRLRQVGLIVDSNTGKIKDLKIIQNQLGADQTLDGALRELQGSSDALNSSTGQLISNYIKLSAQQNKGSIEQQQQKDAVKQLSQIYPNLQTGVDKTGNSIIKNTDVLTRETEALITNKGAVNTAVTASQKLGQSQQTVQKSMQDAVGVIKDYSKYIKEMDANKGNLGAGNMEEIIQKYPQLLQYMGNEKELRNQLQKGIGDEKNTAQSAYAQIIMLQQQQDQALLKEIQTYQQLEASHKTDNATRQQMSTIAQDLAKNIDGLITVTDAEGNVTVQNTGLLNTQMQTLQQEGGAYQDLANIKLSTTKESSEIDVGNTQTTYANAKTRIGIILTEIQALKAKRDAEADVAAAGGAMDMAPSQAFKPYDDEINADNDTINKIQGAMKTLDNLWDNANKSSSKVLDKIDTTSEGLNKNTNGDPAASKQLTAQSRDLANQSRDIAIQSRNLDMQSQALTNQSKQLDSANQALKNQNQALSNQSRVIDDKKADLERYKYQIETQMENAYKAEQQHQEDIINALNKQVDVLEKKKSLMDANNQAADYQAKIQKDQALLENAKSQKNVYTYNNGQ